MNVLSRLFRSNSQVKTLVIGFAVVALAAQLVMPVSVIAAETDLVPVADVTDNTVVPDPSEEPSDETDEANSESLARVLDENEPQEEKTAIDINTADLSIAKFSNDYTPNVGDEFTFTLSVHNDGPATVQNAIATDVLPAGLTFVSAVEADAFDSATGVWTIGEIDDDQTVILDITVTVDEGMEGETIINTASVAIGDSAVEAFTLNDIIVEDVTDPNLDNNTDSVTIEVADDTIGGLGLSSVCSDDPETQRRWKVTNPSDVAVEFTWEVVSTGETGNGTATANSDTYFFTTTDPEDANGYVMITWYDEEQNTLTDKRKSYGKECKDEPCVAGPAFAGSVISSNQGTKNDGSPITDPTRTNPDNTLGAPDNTFFSLGEEGTLVVMFDNYVINVEGDDLSFHEITNSRDVYPEEKAAVEVSEDGINWYPIGNATSVSTDGVSYLDFDSTGLDWIRYVRMTDTTDFTIHSSEADGYDVDAIDATETRCTPLPCIQGHQYATSVMDSAQGTLKNGSPITDPLRTNDLETLGAEDGKFFALGVNGSLTVVFNQFVMNVPGVDLSFHEITNLRDSYPEERASVEVSQDGITWTALGTATSLSTDGVTYLDLETTDLEWIRYVRMTDTTNFGPHNEIADGYDVDAIDATFGACARLELDKHGVYDSVTGMTTFSIDWSVIGDSSIENVQITDPLPAGTSFVSADNGGYLDGTTVKWDLGTLNPGDSGTLTLVLTIGTTDLFGSSVIAAETLQGTQKGGAAVAVDRSDANQALGAPESTGIPYDVPAVPGKFFSLGFNPQGDGGYLTIGFASPIVDGPGDDIKVFEVTNPPTYPDEQIKVSVSNDLTTWIDVGNITRDGTVDLAAGGATTASYVKVTDISDKSSFQDDADAYDVDAIQALHYNAPVCSIENVAYGTWSINETYFGTANTALVIINRELCGEQEIDFVDPGVVKTVDDETPAPGATITYTLTVQNFGTITATNVTVSDTLPEGVTYVSDDGAGAYDSGTHIWTIPSLASGASVTLHITATVDENAEGTIVNTATVTGSSPEDSNEANNTDDASITITTDGDGGDGDGGSNNTSRSSGSGSNDDDGDVLGEFTNVPSTETPLNPRVLGVELPRTGSSMVVLFALFGLAAVVSFATLRPAKR